MSAEHHFEVLQRLAGPVSRETFQRLERFAAEFRRWNQRINLAAASTLDDLWSRHILDSAQLMAFRAEAGSWTDIGSGGGFPGAIIAILADSDCQVSLVESNGKKAAFLRSILAEVAPRAKVIAARAETVVASSQAPEVVSARALASLPNLLVLLEPWLAGGTRALFQKGRDYRGEIEAARDRWNLDLIEHPSAVDPQGVVLELVGIRRR